ncbi:phytochelatin synthase family protein [Erwinia pyrifoliae]|uniref:glutathione gamma-glutamylcysteinyltransferase n=1 Tax=Erwinia pyrifoliae TaxID=79967 RepID=A0ABY5X733_ERWPY|nr:phytochelatin synthase family protein [Erwinia pyrifoliae]AUX71502.1 phytochelatin synthase [Erwinia pyrifoliae]MCA8878285.1 phytochelatin synthase [Erwinia pyrifoliae]MCT2385978.1 phytochelatin synthase family protein [Erwinia pyrifoliae]MCU8588436.1 phytochelatin synthase family protein [Erwinia pyrifoliae]UWS29823.1 phytochelatin synthase family protein [Erwinia pyrifoliae]
MKKVFVTALLACFLMPASGFSQIVDWESSEGIKRLSQADVKQDFFALAPQFEGQSNKVYCGVASATIVLNALRLHENKPIQPDTSSIATGDRAWFPKKNGWLPFWNRYTQNSVVAYSSKPRIEIFGKPEAAGAQSDYGLHLEDERRLLTNAGLRVNAVAVDDIGQQDKMKNEIIAALKQPDSFVIVNFLRSAIGQKGDGHFSPLGAYDAKSDSFLMMDVSNTQHPWVWVDSQTLFEGMHTLDGSQYRGYLTVAESEKL